MDNSPQTADEQIVLSILFVARQVQTDLSSDLFFGSHPIPFRAITVPRPNRLVDVQHINLYFLDFFSEDQQHPRFGV